MIACWSFDSNYVYNGWEVCTVASYTKTFAYFHAISLQNVKGVNLELLKVS